MIVVDASAVVELLLRSEVGGAVGARIGDETLHAPDLMLIEVAQVLRRLCRTGVLSEERADEALVDLLDLDVARYEHQPLVPRAWQLRENLTAYDAVYVALAEALRASLLTGDARLAAAPGHHARVEVIEVP